MYRSFRIKNFRCFKDFNMAQLGRLNLIGGRNNTGKTTILEALFLLIGSHNPEIPVGIADWRHLLNLPKDVYWSLFFPSSHAQSAVELSSTDALGVTRNLRIRPIEPYEVQLTAEEFEPAKAVQSPTTDFAIRGLVAEYTDSEQVSGESRIILGPQNDLIMKRPQIPTQPTGIVLRADFPAMSDLPERFTRLQRKGDLDELIEILRLVEPRLKSLSVGVLGGRSFLFGDIGIGETLPIGVMGDGLNRLAAIILAISAVPDGYVLVDEIENGLHFAILKGVWRGIAASAQKWNVQIYATTHSLECIRAAHAASAESEPYDFLYHRLEMVNGDIEIETLDQDELETSVELNWEIR